MHFHASVFDNMQVHDVYGKRMAGKQGQMDVRAATFSQRELCQITGLDTVTVDTWLIRGILETTKVDGRVLRGRRLFSVLTIFEGSWGKKRANASSNCAAL